MMYSTESPVLLPYYGSTIRTLRRRLKGHKDEFKRWCQGKATKCSSFKLLERDPDKVAIKLVESCPCSTLQELELREAHWIKNNPCINKYIPQGIVAESKQDYRKQYYQLNKELALERAKRYNQANREYKITYLQKYYEKNKEKLREQQKKYQLKNKDKLREQQKKYQLKNKKKIQKWERERIQCECGSEIRRAGIAEHRRTKKHQKWLEQQSRPKIKVKIKITPDQHL